MIERYFLNEQEVSLAEFKWAESDCGLVRLDGRKDRPATAGFTGTSRATGEAVAGRTEPAPVILNQHGPVTRIDAFWNLGPKPPEDA